MDFFIIVKQTS